MSHVFITGDKHGNYQDVEHFCLKWNTSKEDLLIVLGDNGVNYYGPTKDRSLKERLSALPISFFFIKGNHDQRPSRKLYTPCDTPHPLVSGRCLVEDKYPSLIFSAMYGRYSFFQGSNVYNTYVLGGAYSADKYYRLDMNAMGYKGYRWFPDEQMSKREMDMAMEDMRHEDEIDVILSHTCPFRYIPRYMFLSGIDQSTVDDTMEHWMDAVEDTINYKKWYCGHWHTDRSIDKMRFMFHDIIELSL